MGLIYVCLSLNLEEYMIDGNATKGHPVFLSETYKLTGFVAERQGERDEMQDSHVLIDDWTSRFISLDPSM